jgi:hypothetical protein
MSTLFFLLHEGLNLVLSICMGSSFSKVIEGWVGIIGGKFLCVISGEKLLCVVDVGSWRLFCQHSKNLLSHRTFCAMV